VVAQPVAQRRCVLGAQRHKRPKVGRSAVEALSGSGSRTANGIGVVSKATAPGGEACGRVRPSSRS
jgi:hypothetical protein